MQIRFHGAVNGQVTGSCTEFYYKRTNTRFLVDCGMEQGTAHAAARNAKPFAFEPSSLDFVFLTHAHLDHCGLLPKLYKEGFNGKVLCTQATADAAREILQDSAGLPES
ncbi:MAG: MBL fold metallo-hydrolase [Kiritimatiellia bacterium]